MYNAAQTMQWAQCNAAQWWCHAISILPDHQQVQEISRQSAQPEPQASMQQRNLGDCNAYKDGEVAEVIDFTLCTWTKLNAVSQTNNQVQACQRELGSHEYRQAGKVTVQALVSGDQLVAEGQSWHEAPLLQPEYTTEAAWMPQQILQQIHSI